MRTRVRAVAPHGVERAGDARTRVSPPSRLLRGATELRATLLQEHVQLTRLIAACLSYQARLLDKASRSECAHAGSSACIAILDHMNAVENPQETTRPGGVAGAGFKPGQSGNPGGRPKGLARTVREVCGGSPLLLAQGLLEIAENPKARDRDRIAAYRELLDRGWGRPCVRRCRRAGPARARPDRGGGSGDRGRASSEAGSEDVNHGLL